MTNNNIIFFDGVCTLCNRSVRLLISADQKRVLKYTSLQGEFAKKTLMPSKISSAESIIFYSNNKYYEKSEAVIEILLKLAGFYKLIGLILKVMPSFILNGIYDFISRNRYSIFGKEESCALPEKYNKTKDLFLE